MHKDGKWAKQILALQDEEGKWGWFHSLSKCSGKPMTTEQALGRLERLGYTMDDPCIQKTVAYMRDCLAGKKELPDRREKVSDGQIFWELILSTRIRRFTLEDETANRVAQQWAAVVTRAFSSGAYDHEAYVAAYRAILKPRYGRINPFSTYYPVSLMQGCLDAKTECAMVEYLLDHAGGIYYIYDRRIAEAPPVFASRETSRWLAALELLAAYQHARHKLRFAVDWLMENRNENGKWDMGKEASDKVYFPLSDDWRKDERREADCTERIEALIRLITE